jgi:hydrogenase expression/formation protein HypC
MQVMSIDGETAVCEIDGVRREASLMMVDGVSVGDFVIIHAGFAIEKLDEENARVCARIAITSFYNQIYQKLIKTRTNNYLSINT